MSEPIYPTTDQKMSGKRARRLRIRANHERLTKLHAEYWSATLRVTPLGKTPLAYTQWLHSGERRIAEQEAKGRPVRPHRSGGGQHV